MNDLVTPLHPLASEQVSIPTAVSLSSLLGAAEPGAPLSQRFDWLCELGRWLHDPPLRPEIWRESHRPPNTGRLRFLVRVLQLYTSYREAVGGVLRATVSELSALRLCAHAGVPGESSFFAEAASRLARRFELLPRHYRDLAELVALLFPGEPDRAWLNELPRQLLAELAAVLAPSLRDGDSPVPLRVREDACDALVLLAVRASSLGVAEDVRAHLADSLRKSPFVELSRSANALVEAVRQRSSDRPAVAAAAAACREKLDVCRRRLGDIRGRLAGESISVDLVYRLGLSEQLLERMGLLVALLVPDPRHTPGEAVVELLSSVLRGEARRRTMRGIVGASVHQVGQRIADCAGRYGEKYIGRSADEHHGIFASAVGGGLLTAFTVVLKFMIGWASLPLFFEGLFVSADYAGSFLLMQLCGWSLATKQTSLMAASLVRALRAPHEPRDVVKVAVSICRSLFAGVLGNVGAVIPAAVLVDLLSRLFTGHSVLSEERAHHVVESFHPWKSGTIAYATVTGVFLWLGGVASGWFENWSAYRRVPQTLAERPPAPFALHQKLLHALARNPAGTAGSISLGFLLGMVPEVARFFGLPCEVRHVTLATGGLALAGAALGPYALLEPDFLLAMAGIVLIAALNFGVCFALSFFAALRAHGVAKEPHFPLGKEVWRKLVQSPGEFVLPPRRNELPAPAAEGER